MSRCYPSKIYFCDVCSRQRRGNIDNSKYVICWRCVMGMLANNGSSREVKDGQTEKLKRDNVREKVGRVVRPQLIRSVR